MEKTASVYFTLFWSYLPPNSLVDTILSRQESKTFDVTRGGPQHEICLIRVAPCTEHKFKAHLTLNLKHCFPGCQAFPATW